MGKETMDQLGRNVWAIRGFFLRQWVRFKIFPLGGREGAVGDKNSHNKKKHSKYLTNYSGMEGCSGIRRPRAYGKLTGKQPCRLSFTIARSRRDKSHDRVLLGNVVETKSWSRAPNPGA